MSNRPSRFLRQTLMPDERVVRVAHFHGFYTFWAMLEFAFFLGAGFGLYQLMARGGVTDMVVLKAPVAFGGAIGMVLFWSRMLVKWTTQIVLTDRRFLYKRGIFAVRVSNMRIEEINYCTVHQSIWGNFLNYGRVLVYTFTLDDENIFLPAIAEPHRFVGFIGEIKKMRGYR